MRPPTFSRPAKRQARMAFSPAPARCAFGMPRVARPDSREKMPRLRLKNRRRDCHITVTLLGCAQQILHAAAQLRHNLALEPGITLEPAGVAPRRMRQRQELRQVVAPCGGGLADRLLLPRAEV